MAITEWANKERISENLSTIIFAVRDLRSIWQEGKVKIGWWKTVPLNQCVVSTSVEDGSLLLAANRKLFDPLSVEDSVNNYYQRSSVGKAWQRFTSWCSGFPMDHQIRLNNFWQCYQQYRHLYEAIQHSAQQPEDQSLIHTLNAACSKEIPPFHSDMYHTLRAHYTILAKEYEPFLKTSLKKDSEKKLKELWEQDRNILNNTLSTPIESAGKVYGQCCQYRANQWKLYLEQKYNKFNLSNKQQLELTEQLKEEVFNPCEKSFYQEWKSLRQDAAQTQENQPSFTNHIGKAASQSRAI